MHIMKSGISLCRKYTCTAGIGYHLIVPISEHMSQSDIKYAVIDYRLLRDNVPALL